MKKLALFVCLLLLTTPVSSHAQDCQGQQNGATCKSGISAKEMGAIGSGAAVLVGVAGYLVLRRRKSATTPS